MLIKNSNIKNLLFLYLIILFFISMFLLVQSVISTTDVEYVEAIPPTSDNPEGSYDFSAGFDGAVPTHNLDTRTTTNDIDESYFVWSPEIINLPDMPENYGLYLIASTPISEVTNESLRNTEVNDFIFRQPFAFDNVNLFGGGYSSFADFFYVSSSQAQP